MSYLMKLFFLTNYLSYETFFQLSFKLSITHYKSKFIMSDATSYGNIFSCLYLF